MPGTLPKTNAPSRPIKRDEIQAADIPGQAQLQRLAQFRLAVAFALGRLVDQDRADPLNIRRWRLADR